MAEFSDYYENKIIDHMLRGQAFTVPTTLYCAVFTANTGLETNNPTAEMNAGTNYNRPTVTLGAASGGVTNNTANVTFNVAGSDWGTAVAAALVDAPIANIVWGTNVNVLMWTMLDVNKIVNTGDTLQFNVGDLDVDVA